MIARYRESTSDGGQRRASQAQLECSVAMSLSMKTCVLVFTDRNAF